MMNKTIVVLGASRGIGKAIVDLLAQDPSNTIVALARKVDKMKLVFKPYTNVHCHSLYLNQTDVREQCNKIFRPFETIDVLINNAGTLVNKPFAELTRADIDQCYNVNVIGIMQATQAAVVKMKKSHIVNISSIGGFQGSVKFPGLSAYSTSKAALCSFTELFAEEYKETEIRMNCLCLGAVQTEMLEEAFPGYKAPITAEKMAEYIVQFSLTADQWMNGKIIPVSLSTP